MLLTFLLHSFSLGLLLSKTFQAGFAFRLFLGTQLIEFGLALILFAFLYCLFTGDSLGSTSLVLWDQSAYAYKTPLIAYLCFTLLCLENTVDRPGRRFLSIYQACDARRSMGLGLCLCRCGFGKPNGSCRGSQ